jgi:hypothetical protein
MGGSDSGDHSPAPRPAETGTRRSVSVATPQAARGTECPRRGMPYVRPGWKPAGPKPAAGSVYDSPAPQADAQPNAFPEAGLSRHRRRNPP